MALDAATGETIWSMGNDGTCYSSPFLAEIEGVRQGCGLEPSGSRECGNLRGRAFALGVPLPPQDPQL